MHIELAGRHVAITPAIRTTVERRLARMVRMLIDSVVSVGVVITGEKSRNHVDMTLHARGEHFLHDEAAGRDLPTALGTLGSGIAAMGGDAEAGQVRILRDQRHAVRPMPVEEAALEIAAGPDAFLAFRNATTDVINVLFGRLDGNLVLIEPEV